MFSQAVQHVKLVQADRTSSQDIKLTLSDPAQSAKHEKKLVTRQEEWKNVSSMQRSTGIGAGEGALGATGANVPQSISHPNPLDRQLPNSLPVLSQAVQHVKMLQAVLTSSQEFKSTLPDPSQSAKHEMTLPKRHDE